MNTLKERVIKLLQSMRKQIERKEQQIEHFTENPLSLFDDLQHEREIIPDLLVNVDESLLIEYQDWQYPLVQKAILDTFKISPFTISWEPDYFPSPIYLLNNGYPVVAIQPYQQTFELLSDEELSNRLQEFSDLSKHRIDLWEQYQSLQIRAWNPFIDVEDDSLTDAFKITLTKNKKIKEIQKEQELTLVEHQRLTEECNRISLKIENLISEEALKNYEIDKIYNQMKAVFPLKYVDLQKVIIDNVNEQIAKWELESQERILKLENKAMSTDQF